MTNRYRIELVGDMVEDYCVFDTVTRKYLGYFDTVQQAQQFIDTVALAYE